jgi:hypothetical protein
MNIGKDTETYEFAPTDEPAVEPVSEPAVEPVDEPVLEPA